MNNSDMSTTTNNTNISISNGTESSSGSAFLSSSVLLIIEVTIISLTVLLAIAYIALILIRPTFRKNKLNWYTINVCLTSIWFCIITLWMSFPELLNLSSALSCRLETFLVDMSACQLMYSHCVIAISRLLNIVYGNKRFFRSNMCLWVCIATGWLIGFVVSSPYLFVDGFICSSSKQAAFLPYYTLITSLFLPITIVTVCNARTLLFVRNSTRRVHAEGTGNQVSHSRDVLLIRAMIGTFITFLVGWTPVFVTQLFNKNSSIPNILDYCFQVLPSLAVLGGVILVISTNQPVRAFLKQLIVRRPQIAKVNIKRNGHQPNVLNH